MPSSNRPRLCLTCPSDVPVLSRMAILKYTPGDSDPAPCGGSCCRPGVFRSWATVLALMVVASLIVGGAVGLGVRAFRAIAP